MNNSNDSFAGGYIGLDKQREGSGFVKIYLHQWHIKTSEVIVGEPFCLHVKIGKKIESQLVIASSVCKEWWMFLPGFENLRDYYSKEVRDCTPGSEAQWKCGNAEEVRCFYAW